MILVVRKILWGEPSKLTKFLRPFDFWTLQLDYWSHIFYFSCTGVQWTWPFWTGYLKVHRLPFKSTSQKIYREYCRKHIKSTSNNSICGKNVAPMATATKYPDSQNTAGTLALPFAKAAPCAVTPCANKNRDVQNVSESGRSGEPLATSQWIAGDTCGCVRKWGMYPNIWSLLAIYILEDIVD